MARETSPEGSIIGPIHHSTRRRVSRAAASTKRRSSEMSPASSKARFTDAVISASLKPSAFVRMMRAFWPRRFFGTRGSSESPMIASLRFAEYLTEDARRVHGVGPARVEGEVRNHFLQLFLL